jgi:SAM-dependent methyltransferase
MRNYLSSALVCSVAALAAAVTPPGLPQDLTELEAKMFSASNNYERFMGRWSRLLAPMLIEFAGVRDSDKVLDVGTGTGSLASALAASRPASEIIGIDPSKGFIQFAAKQGNADRVRFEVGDAQALRFPNASFDHAMALLVMNFIPDHMKALSEMQRVTRPQGVVSACVWDYDDGMQMLRIFWDEVVALDPAAAPKDERHMKLSREGQLGQLWRKANLVNVQERPMSIDQTFASFSDYWEPFLTGAGPGGAYVVSLSEPRRRELETRLRKRLLDGRDDGAFTLLGRVWCVRGEVPK